MPTGYRQGGCNSNPGVSTGISRDEAVIQNSGVAVVLAETRTVQAQTIASWQFWVMMPKPAGGDQ